MEKFSANINLHSILHWADFQSNEWYMHTRLYLSAATLFSVELQTAQGLGGWECLTPQHMRGFLSFPSFELKWILHEHVRCRGQE